VANQSSPQILSLLLGKLEVLDYIYLSSQNLLVLLGDRVNQATYFLIQILDQCHFFVAYLNVVITKFCGGFGHSESVLAEIVVYFLDELDIKIPEHLLQVFNLLCLLQG